MEVMIQNIAMGIGVISLCLFPMIFLLTRHQQKMALILSERNSKSSNAEIGELKAMLTEQSYAIANLTERVADLRSRTESADRSSARILS